LVDFGLGRILNSVDEVCHTVCGTDTYMSPEVRRLEKDPSADGYNYPVDYWAIGIMLVQLLCGEQLDFYDEDHDLLNFAENLPSYRHISTEARSLVRDLLDIDPKKRLGSANSPHGSIRDHPFFKVGKEMDWDEVDDGVLKPIHDPRRVSKELIYSNFIILIIANTRSIHRVNTSNVLIR
jgi:serine/threonine protein kinase